MIAFMLSPGRRHLGAPYRVKVFPSPCARAGTPCGAPDCRSARLKPTTYATMMRARPTPVLTDTVRTSLHWALAPAGTWSCVVLAEWTSCPSFALLWRCDSSLVALRGFHQAKLYPLSALELPCAHRSWRERYRLCHITLSLLGAD
jgi:hypothetical protein